MIISTRPVSQMTDIDLLDTWLWIDTQRVKSGRNKGHVKLSAAKLGDRIITEVGRRGVRLPN